MQLCEWDTEFFDTDLTPKHIEVVPRDAKTMSIWKCKCQQQKEVGKQIIRLQNLHKLEIGNCDFRQEFFKIISESPSLEILLISNDYPLIADGITLDHATVNIIRRQSPNIRQIIIGKGCLKIRQRNYRG